MEGSSQGNAAALHGCSSEEIADGTPVDVSSSSIATVTQQSGALPLMYLGISLLGTAGSSTRRDWPSDETATRD
jgi:hypothetical protein